jgi:hypothetical protein
MRKRLIRVNKASTKNLDKNNNKTDRQRTLCVCDSTFFDYCKKILHNFRLTSRVFRDGLTSPSTISTATRSAVVDVDCSNGCTTDDDDDRARKADVLKADTTGATTTTKITQRTAATKKLFTIISLVMLIVLFSILSRMMQVLLPPQKQTDNSNAEIWMMKKDDEDSRYSLSLKSDGFFAFDGGQGGGSFIETVVGV